MVLGVAFEKGCDQNQNPLIQTPGYGPDSRLGIPADLLEVKYACNSTNCFKAFLVRDHQGVGSNNLNL